MNAEQFCGEYAHECLNGRISFTMPIVIKFIKTYTYFKPEYFSKGQIRRLRFFMIDLYNDGIDFKNDHGKDLPAEKIELSAFILNG